MSASGQSDLFVVRGFPHLHEADLAKALLDSYGIESWILDEVQLQQRWHVAGPVDVVKLAVAAVDAYRARQILEDDYSDALEGLDEEDPAARSG